jgi:enamine deaminase RidA (YjgF/YER057c/UK114 family)
MGAEDPSRASGLASSSSTDRRRMRSGSPFEKTIGFSRAVRVGNRVLVSGTAPIWPDGTVDPDPYVQARRCFEIIEAALLEAGASLQQVVRTRMFLTYSSSRKQSAGRMVRRSARPGRRRRWSWSKASWTNGGRWRSRRKPSSTEPLKPLLSVPCRTPRTFSMLPWFSGSPRRTAL